MQTAQALVMYAAVQGSHTGEWTFPQIVTRLGEIGVERYHADYCRQETTFYLVDGQSLVIPLPRESEPLGQEFSATDIEAAVRQSQRGEHDYGDFVRKTMSAGCVGYFVQITGRRAIYFGRQGESHMEHFPTAS